MPVGQKWLFGGDWTEQKLDILSDYLCAYNTALKNQPFAGFTWTPSRAQAIVSNARISFNWPAFSRKSAKTNRSSSSRVQQSAHWKRDQPSTVTFSWNQMLRRSANWRSLKREHPDKAAEIHIEQGEANAFVQGYCQRENWRSTRAVLFLDPFATQVEWRTIEAIAHTKAIDVWILFPLMAVNRLLANDPEKACRARLDRIFGTQDWFDAFYRTSKPEDIFGQHLETVREGL